MRKLATGGSAALLALVAVLALAVPADAVGPRVVVKVDRERLRSGQALTVTAQASVRCQWLVTFAGTRAVQAGTRFRSTFTAPAVRRSTRYPVTATCYYATAPTPTRTPPSRTGASERIVVRVPARVSDGVVVTVVAAGAVEPPHQPRPPGGGPAGPAGLPNTGAPHWWLVLAGLSSVAGGTLLVRRSTRRVRTA